MKAEDDNGMKADDDVVVVLYVGKLDSVFIGGIFWDVTSIASIVDAGTNIAG